MKVFSDLPHAVHKVKCDRSFGTGVVAGVGVVVQKVILKIGVDSLLWVCLKKCLDFEF